MEDNSLHNSTPHPDDVSAPVQDEPIVVEAAIHSAAEAEAPQETAQPDAVADGTLEQTEPPPGEIVHSRLSPPISPHGERRRKKRSRIPRRIRRFVRSIPWRVLLVVILLAIIIPAAGVAVFAADAYARVQESLTSLKRVVDSVEDRPLTEFTLLDFDKLRTGVGNFSQSLSRAQQQTGLLQRFATANDDLRALFSMMNAAYPLTQAAQNMLDGTQPALTFLVQERDGGANITQLSSGERLVELLQVGQSRFAEANTQLEAARRAIDQIDLNTLPVHRLAEYQQLVEYHALLNRVNRILVRLPGLITNGFGVETPKNYLVLSQNNDELRPSGGYISTYGWVRLRRFRIADYDYNPTTPLSPNPPPAEMVEELDVPSWWFPSAYPIMAAWSGSWYADFPSTAKMAAWYYDNGQNPRSPVDGVIAIDITGFQMLLEGLGDVNIPGYDKPVNARNFRETIYSIRAEDQTVHKTFLAQVYREILSHWQNLSQEHSVQLLNAAFRALQSKHIMLYFTDPEMNEVVDLLGWSGAQLATTGDYLMVADANLGNKSNSSIRREIVYNVNIQPDGPLLSRALIDYTYAASDAEKDPAVRPEHYGDQKDYFSLVQLYLPPGSELLRAENLQAPVVVDTKQQHTIFAMGMRVRYDSGERFVFDYRTSIRPAPFGPYKRYHLLVQKQPGTQADPLSVQVKLPPGSAVISTSVAPTSSFVLDSPILEFRAALASDWELEIIYR